MTAAALAAAASLGVAACMSVPSQVSGGVRAHVVVPPAPAVVGVVTRTGAALAKQGKLSGSWTNEFPGVTQLAVASDTRHGPLIAVLTKTGRVLAKEGSLTGPWT